MSSTLSDGLQCVLSWAAAASNSKFDGPAYTQEKISIASLFLIMCSTVIVKMSSLFPHTDFSMWLLYRIFAYPQFSYKPSHLTWVFKSKDDDEKGE
jgi:hypothetical protein